MTNSQRKQLKVSKVGLPGSDLLATIAIPQIGQLWTGGRVWDGMSPERSEYALFAIDLDQMFRPGVGFRCGQRTAWDQRWIFSLTRISCKSI